MNHHNHSSMEMTTGPTMDTMVHAHNHSTSTLLMQNHGTTIDHSGHSSKDAPMDHNMMIVN